MKLVASSLKNQLADVGKLLKTLDDLNIANDTIVLYTTENGPHMNSWPDAAMTPYRSEKDTNWEGAFRVPAMIRWPGHIKPGTVSNDISGSHDWFPTLLAAAGDTGVKDRLLQGWSIGDRTYRVATISCPTSLASRNIRRAGGSSTSTTMASLSRYASTTGNWFSSSRKRPVRWISGGNLLPRGGFPCSSICGWTHTNVRR